MKGAVMGHRAHGKLPGWFTRSAAVLLAGVMFCAFAAASASARPHWTMSVSPAQIPRGGNVAITVTSRARCHLILTIKGTHYHYKITGKDLLTIPRTEPTGRAKVEVDCGQWYETDSFKIIKAPLAHRTPITVDNVCHLDPALGTVHDITLNGEPSAYWLNASGHYSMLATSLDGNASVDAAAVLNAQGGIAYFARCTWSKWLSWSQYEQAVGQPQGVSNSEASQFAYLVQEQNTDAIQEEDSDWFTPSPGWQECPTNPYDSCDYEESDDG
jgi:hypothetical protein